MGVLNIWRVGESRRNIVIGWLVNLMRTYRSINLLLCWIIWHMAWSLTWFKIGLMISRWDISSRSKRLACWRTSNLPLTSVAEVWSVNVRIPSHILLHRIVAKSLWCSRVLDLGALPWVPSWGATIRALVLSRRTLLILIQIAILSLHVALMKAWPIILLPLWKTSTLRLVVHGIIPVWTVWVHSLLI